MEEITIMKMKCIELKDFIYLKCEASSGSNSSSPMTIRGDIVGGDKRALLLVAIDSH
jgi:hypothetical protein